MLFQNSCTSHGDFRLQPFQRNYYSTTQQTAHTGITFTLVGLPITQLQVAVSLDLRTSASENIDGESLAAECIRRAHSCSCINVCNLDYCLSTSRGTVMGIARLAFHPAEWAQATLSSLLLSLLLFSLQNLTPLIRDTMPAADKICREPLCGLETNVSKLLWQDTESTALNPHYREKLA